MNNEQIEVAKRKRYARGGGLSGRVMSLEEQAAESVGYSTWYSMDAKDQKELLQELASSGIISAAEDVAMMAKGGEIRTIKGNNFAQKIENGRKFKELITATYNSQPDNDKYPEPFIREMALTPHPIVKYDGKNYVKGYSFKQSISHFPFLDNENFIEALKFVDRPSIRKFEDGGELGGNGREIEIVVVAKRGDGKKDVNRFLVSADDEDEAKRIAEEMWREDEDNSDLTFVEAITDSSYRARYMKKFADGGIVVQYKLKSTGELKSEEFDEKDMADFFIETMKEDDDIEIMPLTPKEEVKEKPKKNLFAAAKPAPAPATGKAKKREQIQVDGIGEQIRRYDALKAIINNAKAEQELIGGQLKEIGREKFLDLYEERGSRPANFDLADGSDNILLEIMDKYLKVEPEKAELLRQYDGLLEEKTTYEFDSDLLEKEVSQGMTIGDVVSMLIQESQLIPEKDKDNLIKAKTSIRIPKGTIDRLMDYENPREIFSLISPILALK